MPLSAPDSLFRATIVLMAACNLPASISFADTWIVSPQLCRGKAFSSTARAANWRYDAEERLSQFAVGDPPMLASMSACADCNLVVTLRVKLDPGDHCRLSVGDSIYEIVSTESRIRVTKDGEEFGADSMGDEGPTWMTLSIRRYSGTLTARINSDELVELGENSEPIDTIRLKAVDGSIAISHFVVSGDIAPRVAPQ